MLEYIRDIGNGENKRGLPNRTVPTYRYNPQTADIPVPSLQELIVGVIVGR